MLKLFTPCVIFVFIILFVLTKAIRTEIDALLEQTLQKQENTSGIILGRDVNCYFYKGSFYDEARVDFGFFKKSKKMILSDEIQSNKIIMETCKHGKDLWARCLQCEAENSLQVVDRSLRGIALIDVDAWWIIQHHDGSLDHACEECYAESEILIPGFKCVFHRAVDALKSKKTFDK